MYGVLFGFIGGILAYSYAVERARDMHPADAGTYLCAAGSAPITLPILGVPAGALLGLGTAALMLLFRAATGRNRLP